LGSASRTGDQKSEEVCGPDIYLKMISYVPIRAGILAIYHSK
jgi:hypothetical protein